LKKEFEKLDLTKNEMAELEKILKREGIASVVILRDHRKRGPVYWSLIFESAKSAPEIFGLPVLKMVNFKGIYLVDSIDYEEKLKQIANKLNSAEAIRAFSKAKEKVDLNLNNLTKEMQGLSFENLPGKKLHELIKRFYDVRYPFTQYSFFFDTITKSVDQVLLRLFGSVGVPLSMRQLAYVPDADTIEFVYLEDKNRFLKKHSDELKAFGESIDKYDEQFLNDLHKLMDDFADFNFVNFGVQLESEENFVKKILKQSGLAENVSKIHELKKKKQQLLEQMVDSLKHRGIQPGFVEALFGFSGNLSTWESEARHTWTRLHRQARPLIKEIGKRAAAKGLLKEPVEIFDMQMKEIIEVAGQLEK